MRIVNIWQPPFGTIIDVDFESDQMNVGDYIKINDEFFEIKGFLMHDKKSILIDKTLNVLKGQEIKILHHLAYT